VVVVKAKVVDMLIDEAAVFSVSVLRAETGFAVMPAADLARILTTVPSVAAVAGI